VASRWEAPPRPPMFAGAWERLKGGAERNAPQVATAVGREAIELVGGALTRVPEGFNIHPKLKKLIIEARAAMAAGEKPCDWGMGEALAFGTLLAQGVRVRLSGQDSRRGTFSHRHSTFFDTETEAEYTPLQHVRDKQGVFEARDSPLSEAGVLGFEYGYSLDMPEGLTIWEAQFGDFVNAAQVIIDQFLASSEAKWHPRERPRPLAAARHGGAGARALERASRSFPSRCPSRTTGRSATSRRRRSTSTRSGARCCGRTASRSS